MFVALNSVEFCNKYVYNEPREEPMIGISSFILWWAMFQFVITTYIFFFVPESDSNGDEDDEDEELEVAPSQVIPIFKDILMKPEIQTYFKFMVLTCAAIQYNSSLS